MPKPFVKWVGGKTQLLSQIEERLPASFIDYYEPFVGGGALYCNIEVKNSTINDMNPNLVNVYRQIRDNLSELQLHLDEMENVFNSLPENEKEKYYYKVRDEFNQSIINKDNTTSNAAQFIFLNKTSFNGLYRCNRSGKFNVAFGKKKKVSTYDFDNLQELSEKLKNTQILTGDFEAACDNAKAGDFVFFDSPYVETFDTYQAEGFSEEDHIRLRNLFKKLTDKGVHCMLTNSNTDFVKELYAEYNIEIVDVRRSVNRDASNRKGQEVIITNYVPKIILNY